MLLPGDVLAVNLAAVLLTSAGGWVIVLTKRSQNVLGSDALGSLARALGGDGGSDGAALPRRWIEARPAQTFAALVFVLERNFADHAAMRQAVR